MPAVNASVNGPPGPSEGGPAGAAPAGGPAGAAPAGKPLVTQPQDQPSAVRAPWDIFTTALVFAAIWLAGRSAPVGRSHRM